LALGLHLALVSTNYGRERYPTGFVLIPELINNDNLYLYRLVQSSVRQDDIEMNINFPRVPHWNMFAVYADHHGVSAFGGRIG
jgi:hypothetical protein